MDGHRHLYFHRFAPVESRVELHLLGPRDRNFIQFRVTRGSMYLGAVGVDMSQELGKYGKDKKLAVTLLETIVGGPVL